MVKCPFSSVRLGASGRSFVAKPTAEPAPFSPSKQPLNGMCSRKKTRSRHNGHQTAPKASPTQPFDAAGQMVNDGDNSSWRRADFRRPRKPRKTCHRVDPAGVVPRVSGCGGQVRQVQSSKISSSGQGFQSRTPKVVLLKLDHVPT